MVEASCQQQCSWPVVLLAAVLTVASLTAVYHDTSTWHGGGGRARDRTATRSNAEARGDWWAASRGTHADAKQVLPVGVVHASDRTELARTLPPRPPAAVSRAARGWPRRLAWQHGTGTSREGRWCVLVLVTTLANACARAWHAVRVWCAGSCSQLSAGSRTCLGPGARTWSPSTAPSIDANANTRTRGAPPCLSGA